MIEKIARYYLYRHIRQDKNQVFYIGIGTKRYKNSVRDYARACSKTNRNSIWKNIVNKNPHYQIDIVLESDDYDFIKEKEKEFIKIYGKIIDNTGTLCNMTDGGDGKLGIIYSEETKRKISNSHKGKKVDKEHIKKLVRGSSEANKKPILQYSKQGSLIKEWSYIRLAAKVLNIKESNISANLRGITSHCNNFIWKFKVLK